jgi:glutathione-regulated potassium-efflux system ancillary protein KefC
MADNVLAQVAVYLGAAVIGVPVAKKLGLGSVLGYLAAGIIIGPFAIGLVGTEGASVMHFAEFGVVMMLFLVGLELRPAMLWEMRRSILGLGGLQVAGTTAAAFGIGRALGLPWKEALAIGLIVALSSTAIVLQTLSEKRLTSTTGGRASFSVLLFQDIAVIPILAIFPLLGTASATSGAAAGSHGGVGALAGWLQTLIILSIVAGIVLAGRYLIRPLFRIIANTRLREAFTATALFIVVGIALLMELVGVSAALGTFLAGVVLADNEYRHELETDIEPFKGLLLGVFFISVGAQIDFDLAASRPGTVAALVAGIIVLKGAVLYILARVFRLDSSGRWLFTLGLAQVGEFAFVLLGYAATNHVLPEETGGLLLLTVALSMAVTPLLFILLERVIIPRITAGETQRAPDVIEDEGNPVVIAGFGRFGQIVGRLLNANGISTSVLDLDPRMVDVLTRIGMKVYYGDATRPDLLRAAGSEHARIFIIAIDDPETCTALAREVKRMFPHLTILSRARNRTHEFDLMREGVDSIRRETLGSALELGVVALRKLGFRAHTAERRAQLWRRFDDRSTASMFKLRESNEDQDAIFAAAKEAFKDAEKLLRDDKSRMLDHEDAGWDNEPLRSGGEPESQETATP